MRIAQFCVRYPPAMGGVETHVQEVARILRARGHEVTVVTTDLETEFPFERMEPVDEPDWVVRHKAFNPFPFHYVVSPGMLKQLSMDVDIIHAHSYGYFHMNLTSLMSKLKGTKLVITPHYHPPWTMIGGAGRLAARGVYDKMVAPGILSCADAIVSVSRSEQKEMEHLIPDSVRKEVIPNGIDFSRFTPPPTGERFREEFGIEGRVMLYTGRLAQNKRLEHVIEVLPDILKEHADLTFVAVGRDNNMKAVWEKLASSKGVEENVRFIDYVPYDLLVDSYGSAEIYVLPSDYEAFGIVLLEAMASRVPIVASAVGGVPDVVEDGKTGLLYEYGDLDALRSNILTLLDSSEERTRMGEAGRLRVEADFTWEKVVDGLVVLYDDLTSDAK